jgi:hypothetical protein
MVFGSGTHTDVSRCRQHGILAAAEVTRLNLCDGGELAGFGNGSKPCPNVCSSSYIYRHIESLGAGQRSARAATCFQSVVLSIRT